MSDGEARDYARKWAWTTAWQAERYFEACGQTVVHGSDEDDRDDYFRNFTRVWAEIHFLMNAAAQLDQWLSETGEDHDLTPKQTEAVRIVRNCMEHWNEARRGEGGSIKASDKLQYGRFQMASWIGRNAPLFGHIDVHELIRAATAIEARLRRT
jgi:hypothetical protein